MIASFGALFFVDLRDFDEMGLKDASRLMADADPNSAAAQLAAGHVSVDTYGPAIIVARLSES